MNHDGLLELVIKINEDAFVKRVNIGRIEGGGDRERALGKWIHGVN